MPGRGKGSLPGRVEGSSRAVLATARPSCLILSRSLDGVMRASPFQTHSIGGSPVGYARVQMLLAVSIAYLFAAQCLLVNATSD